MVQRALRVPLGRETDGSSPTLFAPGRRGPIVHRASAVGERPRGPPPSAAPERVWWRLDAPTTRPRPAEDEVDGSQGCSPSPKPPRVEN